jgi:hypothetical protein
MRLAVALGLVLCLVPANSLADPVYDPQPVPDTAPPDTAIVRSQFQIATGTAKFWFSSSKPAPGFQCQLDKEEYKPCGSPRVYKHLKQGRHAFRVKAVDVAGNVDASPAVVHFKIPRPHHGRR